RGDAGSAAPAGGVKRARAQEGGPGLRRGRPGHGVSARALLRRGGPLLGLVFVCAVFALLVGPQFFRPGNLELIARQTAIVCTAALGMTMVIVAAGIDLSVGSVISLSTVVIALLLKRDANPLVAAAGGVAAAAPGRSAERLL